MLSLLLLTSCYNSENREEILKVYNWADYIDENVLTDFPKWYEEQTEVEVWVSTPSDNIADTDATDLPEENE